MFKHGREFSFVFAAACLLSLPASDARADHRALLRSYLSDLCATVSGGSTADGADVVQSACDFANDQKLDFTPTASTAGVFRLRFVHSSRCLEVAGGSTAGGANVRQGTCDGGTDQQWQLVPAPDGTYEIVARHSGLLLSLATASSAEGVTLQQLADTNGDHQRWRVSNSDNRDPAVYGHWGDVLPWPHIPVSAANLPDGRVLTFSGSERETWPGNEFTYSATWDPLTGLIQEISHQTHNMFCAHLAMTLDGRVFVNGGRNQTNSPWTSLFDYVNDEWVVLPNMATGGRWYPTTVALADGDMFTAIGTATNQRNPERWDARTGWRILTGIDFQAPVLDYETTHDEWRWWPLLHLAPQGKIFHSGPTPTVGWINTSGTGSYQDTGIRLDDWYHKHGTTILYDKGRILTAGGWQAGHTLASTAQAFTVDLNGPVPVVTNIAPMNHARKFHNGILLPNGEVLVVGGNTSGQKFSDSGAVYAAEIWNPTTGLWRDVANMTVPRNYHSVGLLLPDGRVLAGGGGYCSGSAYCSGASHPDVELFSPPYLFLPGGAPAPRPSIVSGPGMIDNGTAFDVEVSGAVDSFSMIKMGATTHGMNTDVRYLLVPAQDLGGGSWRLTVDGNPNVLTPGYWMLFALAAGVPSEAHVLQVGNLDVRLENLAPRGGASQSSTKASAFDLGAANALDGDMTGTEASGSLTHTDPEANAWWELDLFSVYEIDAVRLWNRTDCCTGALADFYVLVSDEPFVSADLAAARAQSGVSEYHVGPAVAGQLDLTIGRTGRFVRVQLAGTDALALAEVQVFGEAPGAGTPGLLHYDYYQGSFGVLPDFSTLTPARSGTVDGFVLTPKSDDTDYAFRFYGRLDIALAGTYTFYTTSDDGSRLWIDGALVVDNDGVHAAQEQQGSISLGAGEHDILVGYFQSTGSDSLLVSYAGPGVAKQAIPSSAVSLLPAGEGRGSIRREWWLGISGTAISALTGDPRFPDSPDGTDERNLFEAPINWSDNHGQRMRGFLYPPFSGLYTFWIASDDNGELWVSTDEQPANAARIAWVPGWSSSRQWDKFPEQQSAPVFLQSGQRYYVEALQKEGGGGDNLAVAWATPFAAREVIDGAYLAAPFEALEILGVDAPPQVVSSPVTMVADVAGDGVTHSWSFGDGTPDTPFLASNLGTHTYPGPGRYSVTLTVRDIYGGEEVATFPQLVHAPLTAGRPNASSSIVFHDSRAEVWNVNPDNDSVSALDANLGILLAEIPVTDDPRSVTVAFDGSVWVTSRGAGVVSVIDPATHTVDATIPMGRGTQPHGIVADRTTPDVYVALAATGELVKLDAISRAEVDRAFVARDVRGLSLTADGSTLLVSQFITPPLPGENTASPTVLGEGGRVHRVQASDLSLIGTSLLQHSDRLASEHTGPGMPNYLQAAVISPDGASAWVPSKQDNILRGMLRDGYPLTHDQTVRAISSRILLPGGSEQFPSRIDHDNASIASAAAFDPWGLHLFTALEGNRQIAISDAQLGSELLRVDVGRAPQGLAISPSGNMLYVHNFMDRSVSLVDISALSQTGDLEVIDAGTISTVTTETLPPDILTGKQLFYDARDTRLAAESYMACASCHNGGGEDGRVWDFTGFGEGLRNTLTLEGRGDHGPLHWTANFDEVQDFENQIRSFAGGTGLMSPEDFAATEEILGPPKAGLSADLDALASYLHSLTQVPASPQAVVTEGFTPDGENGRLLFQSLGCDSCHAGPKMTDSPTGVRHDIGTILPSSGSRMGGPLDGFDTPSLLGVWRTPPHLHDGSAQDIAAAILAHSGHSGLTGSEVDLLVAYLQQVELGDGIDPCLAADDDCDGVDDDCDGTPDDGFVELPTSCGIGACGGNAGMLICTLSGPVDTCDPFLGSSPEACDGIDNDCDGAVDEDGICPPECVVDADCDDGSLCTGAESCVDGSCLAGSPLSCDDGQFCNGGETCDAVAGCLRGTAPCSGDLCDEVSDVCDPMMPAGIVPDGNGVPGAPLLVVANGGGDLDLSWSPSCMGTDLDYAIYEGDLGSFTTHAPLTCSTGGLTSTTVVPGAGSHYYLVVPLSPNREGSYGFAGDGAPRPPGVVVCMPQAVATCE